MLSRFSERPGGFVLAIILIVSQCILPACSRKQNLIIPPIGTGGIRIEDNRILWSTEVATRGAVRYGFLPDDLDHMAYPDATGRADRTPTLEHSVALLDLLPGRRTYYRVVDELGGVTEASSLLSFVPDTGPTANLLTSTMIHVGFGDSHLLSMPTTGTKVLIDAGERGAAGSVARYLRDHNVSSVDVVLATHVHIDHLGGFVGFDSDPEDGVLETYAPGVFLDSPTKTYLRAAYEEAMRVAGARGIAREVVTRGQTSVDTPVLRWDPEVLVVVLNSGTPPGYVSSGHENTDINNDSIVLKLTYGDVDFVIGGDAEDASESSILQGFDAAELEVEYYKVHHHGLQDASSSTWVSTLRPRVAFVPNTQLVWDGSLPGALAESTERLRGQGTHIYAVDDARSLERLRGSGRQYNVSFVTDGTSYEVRLELATQPVPAKATEGPECSKEAVR